MIEITVVIPCYNNAATIEAAILSALRQTVPTQVIVVDDGSSDETVPKVQVLAASEPNLALLIQPQNRGPSAARNRAISMVETEWIAILDGDDFMHEDRLRRLLEIAEDKHFDFLADDLIRVDPGPDPTRGSRLWSDQPIGLVELDLARFARENIDKYTGSRRELGYLKPIMRTDFLRSNTISYNESMRLSEDYDLYARALVAGARFGVVDPCGYFSVDYPNSLSKEYAASDLRKILDRDIELLRHPDLSPDARKAVAEHKTLAHKQWAWMHLIEMKRDRNLTGALAVIAVPPQVMGALILRTVRHLAGLEPVPSSAGGEDALDQGVAALLAATGGCEPA
jgi:succinoglycan biosynthesis protein ExoU